MTKVIVLMSVRAGDWKEYAEDAANGRLADDPGERYSCITMFRDARNAGVAYADMLDLIEKNAFDIPMLVQTSQDAVALALRAAVARGLVRAKDARIVFFDGKGERHVIRIEDVLGADGTRTIDFSHYPKGFLDVYPNAAGDLCDARPYEGWEPHQVFTEDGELIPEIAKDK